MTQRRLPAARAAALAVAAIAGALALWLAATAVALWSTLAADERELAARLLAPRGDLLMLSALVLLAALGWAVPRAFKRWVEAPARLLENASVVLGTDTRRELSSDGGAALQGLAQAINTLVRQRAELRADIAQQVSEASRGIEQERSRLAALMSELKQAVVVCNLDGRILLYNASARAQSRALSPTPSLADGAELIGLGRSVYMLFDPKLVAHALEKIEQKLLRGAAQPSAQFLTATEAGQWLRVVLAPVRDVPATVAADDAAPPALNGFVLLLDNITREFEQESSRDRRLNELTERSRASLGNLQAAIEMLDYPDLGDAQRERFQAVVRDEVQTMSRRIEDLAAQTTQSLKTRWPLEDMLGTDLVAAALRRIEALPGLRAAADEVDAELWLQVDSFSLLQALAYLAGRLAEDYAVRLVRLRLAPAGQRAQLDLIWAGQAMSTETLISWESDAMRVGDEASPLTVRDVVQRHGGAFWFERERVRHEAFFRFLLPLAASQPGPASAALTPHDSRPEFYDFDLFRASEHSHALDERPLVELTYTVFDTETTGLNPSQGDEIIQIGATRVVNGKLLRQDSFEQLVDPQRDIPAAGIPIHGIEPAMVAGQPTISAVLPAFHAFARDTVLVAHNAAFDMRFLQLKEAATGLRFDQPVLDTLLLSAVVHPNQDSHRLEAIAERLAIPVVGRHTALGDAIVTAEVLLKLIPLLAAQGIGTLGQARAAAQKTFYARLNY